MSLSCNKLEELLISQGYFPTKYYTFENFCFFIELFIISTSEVILLYIPSKYSIVPTENQNVYKLKKINIYDADKTDDYAGYYDKKNTEHIELRPDDNLEEHLYQNYKHAVPIKDISREDSIVIRAIFRQLKRLSYSVENISYKLGISYKNYICTIKRNNSVQCYFIKHYPAQSIKKFYIIVDLETIYNKKEKLFEDLSTVKDSIYRVLEKNQNLHTHVITEMLNNRKDIISIPFQAQKKKENYDEMTSKLSTMLSDVNKAEHRLKLELNSISSSNTSLDTDISRIHRKNKLEQELDKINSIKKEIATILVLTREKRENSLLCMDKILFDNSVMWDAMVKNFALLKDFC